MRRSLLAVSVGLLFTQAPTVHGNTTDYERTNTLIPAHAQRYQASIFPDRVAILPGTNPAREHQITWRTDASLKNARVQITPAQHTPGLHLTARELTGESILLESSNGIAHHHRVQLNDLVPDTLYAYRVEGSGTWSNWYQFRTPVEQLEPFSVLYFGDAQNAVLSHYARTVRAGILHDPDAKLMLYAGDLVNSRDGIHDDEWGEWFDATSWMAASIGQLPAAGNHEHSSDDDDPIRYLLPNWRAQFEVADNGPEGLTDTVYYVDYQGVRFIVLDSTAALQSETDAQKQADWLAKILADNPNQWTVAMHHHPVFSVSRGRDNPPLRKYWQPLYEQFGVDLILQGHDHTYGRAHDLGDEATQQGPVYVVTVAGPKMYRVSDIALESMDRLAEDTQLFQTLNFDEQQIRYESLTVTGELYDAFTLKKDAKGVKTFVDEQPSGAMHTCGNPQPSKPSRCWDGVDLIHAPVRK